MPPPTIDPYLRPGVRAWRIRRYLPPEEGRVYELLAVAGTPSVFDALGIGPAAGHAVCRYRRSGRRAELVEIPLTDLMAVPSGWPWDVGG